MGLDPAIHPFRKKDAQVRPAQDDRLLGDLVIEVAPFGIQRLDQINFPFS